MIGKRTGWLVGIFVLGMLAGCGDPSGPDTNPSGHYVLQRVNDGDLPRELEQRTDYSFQILIGSLRIHEDSTFVRSTTSREIDGATTTVQTQEVTGTWTRAGDQITFTVRGQPNNISAIQERDIIVVLDSVTFEYRR